MCWNVEAVEAPPVLQPFIPFGKIPRLNRGMIITEKLDGTNAGVFIEEDGVTIRAASRNRFLTPDDDNYGFARWVQENSAELLRLGPGRHWGEWWGRKIGRGYGLIDRRFSLFNVQRWNDLNKPACCLVVPTLYRGDFDTGAIDRTLALLRERGSMAAGTFMDPEGIVVFHSASGQVFKVTCEHDESPKSLVKESC